MLNSLFSKKWGRWGEGTGVLNLLPRGNIVAELGKAVAELGIGVV